MVISAKNWSWEDFVAELDPKRVRMVHGDCHKKITEEQNRRDFPPPVPWTKEEWKQEVARREEARRAKAEAKRASGELDREKQRIVESRKRKAEERQAREAAERDRQLYGIHFSKEEWEATYARMKVVLDSMEPKAGESSKKQCCDVAEVPKPPVAIPPPAAAAAASSSSAAAYITAPVQIPSRKPRYFTDEDD